MERKEPRPQETRRSRARRGERAGDPRERCPMLGLPARRRSDAARGQVHLAAAQGSTTPTRIPIIRRTTPGRSWPASHAYGAPSQGYTKPLHPHTTREPRELQRRVTGQDAGRNPCRLARWADSSDLESARPRPKPPSIATPIAWRLAPGRPTRGARFCPVTREASRRRGSAGNRPLSFDLPGPVTAAKGLPRLP